MNDENLIPITERPESEQRAMRLKAGIASGASRRRKRDTAKLCKLILSLRPDLGDGTVEALKTCGYDPDRDGVVTTETLILLKVAAMAQEGDLSAIKLLYDYALIPDIRAQLEREKLDAMKPDAGQNDDTLKALIEAWDNASGK